MTINEFATLKALEAQERAALPRRRDVHAAHERLAGYHPETVLHDGCPDCEERSRAGIHGLLRLDDRNLIALWALMRAEKWSGGTGVGRTASDCDHRAANTLYAIGVLLQRSIGTDPAELQEQMERHSAELRERLGIS